MDTTSLPARIAQSRRHLATRESLPEACDATVRYIEADHTGLPMRREELVGRKGKAPDGTAKTRMAVLGCVFTQHGLDEQGQPLRDHQSTTYLAGFESPTDFGSFRKQGFFIGSGVIGAGCRSVIGLRCKQSGMFWTEHGANAVRTLRCLNAGGNLDAFWKARHAA